MGSQKMPALLSMALAAALVALPAQVDAQQPGAPGAQQQACSAQFTPAQVSAGEAAVPVMATVSAPIGEVTGVEAPDGSGIQLAEAGDLPRTPLAGPDEPPEPIRMGDAENQWVLYLNLSEAEAGTHELTLTSSRGNCTAEITVR